MAGDWIKMRIGLADDPAVIAISCATKLDVDTVVGKLHRVWGWADQNTADGRLEDVPSSWIDTKVGKKGFADAMAATSPPWLLIDDKGITIPNFDHHNGTSAKSRAENTKRAQTSRKTRDKSATREEKRRILTAAHDGDWGEARQMANELTKKLGRCSKEIDRRLILGSCYLAINSDLDPNWLEIGTRETNAAKADKPYAFFQKVVENLANDEGVNLKSSLARLEIPAELLEVRKKPC